MKESFAEQSAGAACPSAGKLNDQQLALVESNMKLVTHVINRQCGNIRTEDYMDAYQAGMLGLCKAAAKYDPARGFAFSTFAYRCITNEIYMVFRRWKKLRCYEAVSIETSIFQFDDDGDVVPLSERLCAVEDADSGMGLRLLLQMLDERFDDRDRKIIQMTIGGMTQMEIAGVIGVSQPIVSRRLKRIQEVIRREHCGVA